MARILLLFPLVGAGGCTALRVAPEPVLTTGDMAALVRAYPPDAARVNFYSTDATKRGGLAPQQYRNLVTGIYMGAIDSNFHAFRSRIFADERETAVGMDLLVLGISGVAAIARPAALEGLAAASGVAVGARATIDRNLFFDRTLPAVFATIEADRTRVRRTLLEKMRLTALEYPISAAFADLDAYQAAGSIDRGIQRLNQVAGELSAEQQTRLDNALLACSSVTEQTATINERLSILVDRVTPESERGRRLSLAAHAMGAEVTSDKASPGENNDATWDNIVAVLETKYCSDAERSNKIDAIAAQIN